MPQVAKSSLAGGGGSYLVPGSRRQSSVSDSRPKPGQGKERMHRPLLFCAVLSLTAGAAWGQSPPAPDQTEQIRILLERVQQLEKRVSELETRQPAAASPMLTATSAPAPVPSKQETAETPASAAQAHQHESQETQATVHQMETHYPSLQIRGFG